MLSVTTSQELSGTATLPILSCSDASMIGSRQSWGMPCLPLTKNGRIRQEHHVYQAAIAVQIVRTRGDAASIR